MIKSKHSQNLVFRKLVKGWLGKNDDVFRYIAEHKFGFTVGEHTYRYKQLFNNNSYVKLRSIGKYCSLGHNLIIAQGNHPMNFVSTHPFLYDKKYGFLEKSVQNEVPNEPVTIGNDVWIGLNVTILPNVTIGNGAVVGAGSIVNRDVPPYAIVAGVPAKVIRYRFTPEQIEQLEQLKWWDLPDEQIRRNLPHFYNVEDIKNID
ncbi:CatB-related O-acetyltransferase [Vibrio sinaloensis]|uniref:CatB-related O-acetyltransferase n=1 Tax=Photobacterium sp. (strain ATCC 43367) TaxID=379097 RepID=UPI0035E5E15E